jgi:predicted component of type VI protein secretion system
VIVLKEMNGPQSGRLTRSPLVEVKVGRDPSADLIFDKHAFPTVSRIHATIRFDGRWYRIDDDDSRHGTWVNGQRLGGLTYLKHGDVIQLGGGTGPKIKVQFKYDRKAATVRSEASEPATEGLFGVPWVWVIVFGGFALVTLIFFIALMVMMN